MISGSHDGGGHSSLLNELLLIGLEARGEEPPSTGFYERVKRQYKTGPGLTIELLKL